jgi:hypothetical protein
MQKMEDLQQEQSKELKNKVVSSQQSMKMELREESLTSNMAHVVD